MEIFSLTKFQIEKLVDFCFDVVKGSLLAGLGFTAAVPTQFLTRVVFFTGGLTAALVFVYTGLWLGREIK